ncbi:DUF305 domain-containing protein [Saccharomonospora glauca]|uniref:DUF305 domain-containing protein n=1 Tax=Saccharomonospora glauca K62 TaxID=928724 RepID=I1CY14_9PSEU|nr:DUF305 domain-containing protein [Saccharomonospora glauca]EIE97588.1 hypothetical protein SacglDRAFT_00642 [Saccharomonospora glauca K62]
MPHTRRILPSLALLLTLTAACGTENTTEPSPPPSTAPKTASATSEPTSDHNRGDVEFATRMIPHHEQAVVVADLALEHASNPEIADLARRIKAAQEPELERLLALPILWGETATPGEGERDHDHSHLMTEETFQALQQSSGEEFDALWLQTMIEHHEGAVHMAEAQLRDGRNALASMYAQDIIDRHNKEIDEMRTLAAQ